MATITDENDRPLLKIGVLGDVQALPARHDWGMHNFALALEQLRAMQIDVLLNLGDLAEGANPETYRLYWQLIEERFGKNGVLHVACEGNHDFNRPQDYPPEKRFSEICRGMRRSTDNPLLVTIRGIDFIVLSSDCEWEYDAFVLAKLEKMLQTASSRSAGKPVFLLTHFPPADTMSGSFSGTTSVPLRKLLNRYPQVISLSGHTHYPLNDERALWQGEFTAITCGTLAYGCIDEPGLFNCVNGILPFAREAVQFMRMDLFGNRLEVHRFNVLDGTEIAPEKLWRLPLPYLRPPVRSRCAAPEFAPDARLLTRYDYGYMFVIFDRPAAGDFAHYYEVELTEKQPQGWGVPQCVRYAGDFYRLKEYRQGMMVLKLPGLGMKSDTDYRIRVTALASDGQRSRPLEILEHTWPGYHFLDGTPTAPQE